MMYVAIVLMIVSCMMVLVKFWQENDTHEEKIEEKPKKIVQTTNEKQTTKSKKNK